MPSQSQTLRPRGRPQGRSPAPGLSATAAEAALRHAAHLIPGELFLLSRHGELLFCNGPAGQLLRSTRLDGLFQLAVHGKPPTDWIAHALAGGVIWLHRPAPAPHGIEALLATAAHLWRLTNRQTQVLELLAAGESNKRIAERLSCTVGTVELHVTALLRKANARTRLQLATRLLRLRAP